ncbi:hypothetical protein SRIMM317S_00106 [Streptomyces rimosus subsp. rimosus]
MDRAASREAARPGQVHCSATAPDFGPRIDPYAPYDPQRDCDPAAKPGVTGFRDLVLAAYRDTRDLGISRPAAAAARANTRRAGPGTGASRSTASPSRRTT